MESDDATKEAVIRRYRMVAAREAAISVVMLLLYFTVPLWPDEADAATFSALLLAAAGIFASLAAAMMWAAELMKRDRY